MDPEALATTVICSALTIVIQTIVIVWLYNHYIIPKIVMKVQSSLITKMEQWVSDLKLNLADNVKTAVDIGIENLKKWVSGKTGNSGRRLTLAKSFLDENLPQDPSDDEEGWSSVITEAVVTYGRPLVENALRAIRPKAAAAPIESAETGGW